MKKIFLCMLAFSLMVQSMVPLREGWQREIENKLKEFGSRYRYRNAAIGAVRVIENFMNSGDFKEEVLERVLVQAAMDGRVGGLWNVCQRHPQDLVKGLLSRRYNGYTLAHIAAMFEKPDFVDALVNCGVDMLVKSHDGLKPAELLAALASNGVDATWWYNTLKKEREVKTEHAKKYAWLRGKYPYLPERFFEFSMLWGWEANLDAYNSENASRNRFEEIKRRAQSLPESKSKEPMGPPAVPHFIPGRRKSKARY